jgi:hypothetical protein
MRELARDGVPPRRWEKHLRAEMARLIEADIESQCTAEAFEEWADANGREYRADGGEL